MFTLLDDPFLWLETRKCKSSKNLPKKKENQYVFIKT